MDLSPETRLVLACCRWPRSPARSEAIASAAAVGIDWTRFLAAAEKHRVEGLVHNGLLAAKVEVPAAVAQVLRGRGLAVARRSLLLAGETVTLIDALHRAGIRALVIKGSSVEMLAYGELGLKSAWDIDILVDRADLARVGEVLGAGRWRRTFPAPEIDGDRLALFFDNYKDALFVHAERGTAVELHHRLVWHAGLDRILAAAPLQLVELRSGARVPTLAMPELLLYLSVHGAIHEWSRIKWLADVAALLSDLSPEEIDGLWDMARSHRAERFVGQALLLCHRLLAVPVPDHLLEQADTDRHARRLVGHTARRIDHIADETGLDLHLATFRGYMHLGTDWRSRVELVRRTLFSPADLAQLPLPRPLFILYPLARLPLALLRWLRRPGSETSGRLQAQPR